MMIKLISNFLFTLVIINAETLENIYVQLYRLKYNNKIELMSNLREALRTDKTDDFFKYCEEEGDLMVLNLDLDYNFFDFDYSTESFISDDDKIAQQTNPGLDPTGKERRARDRKKEEENKKKLEEEGTFIQFSQPMNEAINAYTSSDKRRIFIFLKTNGLSKCVKIPSKKLFNLNAIKNYLKDIKVSIARNHIFDNNSEEKYLQILYIDEDDLDSAHGYIYTIHKKKEPEAGDNSKIKKEEYKAGDENLDSEPKEEIHTKKPESKFKTYFKEDNEEKSKEEENDNKSINSEGDSEEENNESDDEKVDEESKELDKENNESSEEDKKSEDEEETKKKTTKSKSKTTTKPGTDTKAETGIKDDLDPSKKDNKSKGRSKGQTGESTSTEKGDKKKDEKFTPEMTTDEHKKPNTDTTQSSSTSSSKPSSNNNKEKGCQCCCGKCSGKR